MKRVADAIAIVAALLLCAWAAGALTRLAAARAMRDAAAGGAGTLALAGPRAASIAAADAADAAARLATVLGNEAATSAVRLTLSPPPAMAADPAGIVRLRVIATGEEARMRRFAAAAEAGPPAVRWSRWSLGALPGGQVRLEAEAVAPWRAS